MINTLVDNGLQSLAEHTGDLLKWLDDIGMYTLPKGGIVQIRLRQPEATVKA